MIRPDFDPAGKSVRISASGRKCGARQSLSFGVGSLAKGTRNSGVSSLRRPTAFSGRSRTRLSSSGRSTWKKRAGKKKAIVALARKLAVLMHRLWVTGLDFEPFPAN